MGSCDGSAIIQGMQVLVVEDEAMLVFMLEDMLSDLGCAMAGSAGSVAQALAQISALPNIEAAILDVHLGGETVFPVADALIQRHIPFVFSTGYSSADLSARYPGSPLLAKPYPPSALASVLADLRQSSSRSGRTNP